MQIYKIQYQSINSKGKYGKRASKASGRSYKYKNYHNSHAHKNKTSLYLLPIITTIVVAGMFRSKTTLESISKDTGLDKSFLTREWNNYQESDEKATYKQFSDDLKYVLNETSCFFDKLSDDQKEEVIPILLNGRNGEKIKIKANYMSNSDCTSLLISSENNDAKFNQIIPGNVDVSKSFQTHEKTQFYENKFFSEIKNKFNNTVAKCKEIIAIFLRPGSNLNSSDIQLKDNFIQALGYRESTNNYGRMNDFGFIGKYQMGERVLTDIGVYKGDKNPRTNNWIGTFTGKYDIYSVNDFLNNPNAQEKLFEEHMQLVAKRLKEGGADEYIGTVIDGIKITQSGLLAASHLAGVEGTMLYLQSNGKKSPPPDKYGTSLTEYLQQFADYDVQKYFNSPT